MHCLNFSEMNLVSFWKDVHSIFDEFLMEKMPSECYGWRSWKIEKAFEKNSRDKLKWVDGTGYDFIGIDKLKYEFKQVKDAFKKNQTPSIVIKNWRKDRKGYKNSFDYLIVADVDREILGIFDAGYVQSRSSENDATVTAVLENHKAKLYTLYNEIS